ncbi:MAG: hypothetical protein HY736_26420 [Verrucomicrobia bacterium]|nr:hypothetical protein [Verrucomicrobiota bacterium]
MTPIIKWLDPNNPLPTLERKWTSGGELAPDELQRLDTNWKTNPDVRVREHCRILLNAIETERSGVSGATETDPHAQRLLRVRHQNVFTAKTVTQGL